ncbi:PadR family transcriptional regulator [Planococcus salinus]|uniref:PadR family transcriptional regulator n=1 Tax=Planococcus salinus TaxID=1848460 RepID=A0A3M8PAJ5_9BACL|nr:PadR family transcriptional regulator [Planococcus salinus]RNF40411.1 PadR family transcriptional regulator [Planococcus salinus]
MSKENPTQYAILGLLTTGCTTGYSMKQMIDGSLNHFWKISYGQIYPTLKLLVEKGFATVEELEQEGKPDKKEYQITDFGMEALKKWLEQPIAELPVEKNELLLKLFFSRHQNPETARRHLDDYLARLLTRHNTYEAIKNMISTQLFDEQDAPFWIITLDYGLRTTQAAIDWCEDTKSLLLKKEG